MLRNCGWRALPAQRSVWAEVAVGDLSVLERLARLAPGDLEDVLWRVPADMRIRLGRSWEWLARPSQLPPEGGWSQWLILAGRGFGKTRAGAEWITRLARAQPEARFALVGATAHDVASVMIEGDSGLLAVAEADFRPEWVLSRRMLLWPNGAQATAFSAAEPNQLRGPQFHFSPGVTSWRPGRDRRRPGTICAWACGLATGPGRW